MQHFERLVCKHCERIHRSDYDLIPVAPTDDNDCDEFMLACEHRLPHLRYWRRLDGAEALFTLELEEALRAM